MARRSKREGTLESQQLETETELDESPEQAAPAEDRDASDAPRAKRRTLGAMAADSGSAEGIRCPHCGCGHSQVLYTWDTGGARRRKRACRNCGREFPTTER